jgi:hypothetical protein
MIELGAAPITVPIELEDRARDEIARLATADVVENRVALNLEGLQYDQNPGVTYEIYLNLPEGQEPDYQSEYYVGNIGFFALEPHGHAAEEHGRPTARLSFDITDIVRALQTRREWKEGQPPVTFVMRGLLPPAGRETAAREAEPGVRARIERVTITTE